MDGDELFWAVVVCVWHERASDGQLLLLLLLLLPAINSSAASFVAGCVFRLLVVIISIV